MKKAAISAAIIASLGIGAVAAAPSNKTEACKLQQQIRDLGPLFSGFKAPGCDK